MGQGETGDSTVARCLPLFYHKGLIPDPGTRKVDEGLPLWKEQANFGNPTNSCREGVNG